VRVLAVVFALVTIAALGLSEREQAAALDRQALVRIFATTFFETMEGRAPGDHLVVNKILSDRNDRIIGHGDQVCTRLDSGVSSCIATFVLPKGKIMVQGTRHRRDYYVLAVVGGTGIYSASGGTLIASTVSREPRRERLLFSLEP